MWLLVLMGPTRFALGTIFGLGGPVMGAAGDHPMRKSHFG
jgi:hypothetical protein